MKIEPKGLRQAFGKFATGVTIVTARDAAGKPVGVTASSFNSVSMDPPMILWSLGRQCSSFKAFMDCDHFAVHVLSADQDGMAMHFARSGGEKFTDLIWHAGLGGAPVLDEYLALFQCHSKHKYDGGDHVIFVGQVVALDVRDASPLLFHGGQFTELADRVSSEAKAA